MKWFVRMGGVMVATAFVAGAQPADTALSDVVVTARGRPARISEIPGGVGVISAEDIAERQSANVADAVREVPGVSKLADSPWGSEINIRGLSRNAVISLIDDCRVLTSTDLNAQFGMLDPNEIERIEILKGPISSLYGSGAIGGIVNVITRTGSFSAEPQWKADLRLNARSNPRGAGGYGYATAGRSNAYVYASQSYRSYSSYKDGSGEEMRNSQFRDDQTTAKGGYQFQHAGRLEGQFQYYEGHDIGLPGMGAAPLPQAADVTYPDIRRRLFNLRHTLNPVDSVWSESMVNLFVQSVDRRVIIDHFPTNSPLRELDPGADHGSWGGAWRNTLALGPHTVVAGVDGWRRTMDSFRTRSLKSGRVIQEEPLPSCWNNTVGLFAEDAWRITKRFTLSAGLRGDQQRIGNDSNAQWSARTVDASGWNAHLGGTLLLAPEWSATLIGARGYRAATLEERYKFIDLGNGTTAWGNPDLAPEQNWFTEAGLHWQGWPVRADCSAYLNELEDLIADQKIATNRFELQNVQRAQIWGVEGQLAWYVAEVWQLYGRGALAYGQDRDSGDPLPGIAPFTGAVGVRAGRGRGLWGSLESDFAARQDRTPENIAPAAGWADVDLRVGYDFRVRGTQQRVYAGVDNLLAATYHEYLTTSRGFEFNEPGRSFIAGYQMDL